MTYESVSGRAARYLRKAGIPVRRPGSHTLRHTCVQRLVDADFSLKTIGDYVGHRCADSTAIYAKVAVDALRKIGSGVGEDVL
jgi:integrase